MVLQLVAKLHLLRGDEAQSGVVDLQIARERWKGKTLICRRRNGVSLVVRNHLLDVHGRRPRVDWKVARIDDAHAIAHPLQLFAQLVELLLPARFVAHLLTLRTLSTHQRL